MKFTQEELAVLNNDHFFFVKRTAAGKIMDLFGEIEVHLKEMTVRKGIPFDEEINVSSGKIFRGENYLNLPYIVLDYPRLFNTKSVFAFRTMYWWANGFSFTLHLQGKVWESRRSIFIKNIELLKNKDVFICINDTPWQYHFLETNYIRVDDFLEQGRMMELNKMSFLKISTRLEIEKYAEAINQSKRTFELFLTSVFDQDPM